MNADTILASMHYQNAYSTKGPTSSTPSVAGFASMGTGYAGAPHSAAYAPYGTQSTTIRSPATSTWGTVPMQAPQPPQSTQQQLMHDTNDRFGLTGLLGVIRMTDQDLNTLTLGFDLTTLGLNLNSPEYLYSAFASPWSDSASKVIPEYKLPPCYFMPSLPPLKRTHFQKFNIETLFYIFYSMPQDVLQLVAAQELYNREWRYHKGLQLWLTRVPNTEPTAKTPTYEKGSYYYFDVSTWQKVQKDGFLLEYAQLEDPKNLVIVA